MLCIKLYKRKAFINRQLTSITNLQEKKYFSREKIITYSLHLFVLLHR